MLYDHKRWDKPQVKADPFSLESLIAWLEKQPVSDTYVYSCNGHCLLAQYFTAAGFLNVQMFTGRFEHGDGKVRLLPDLFNAIALDAIEDHSRDLDYTFGGALARARKVAAK